MRRSSASINPDEQRYGKRLLLNLSEYVAIDINLSSVAESAVRIFSGS